MPDDFAPPKGGAPALGADKKPNVVSKSLGKALKPFSGVAKKTVAGPMSLMEKSAQLMKRGDDVREDNFDGAEDADAKMKALMEDPNE
eukprot:SAG31_NODE_31784_length_364_cov_0.784906_1_plen_87_part_10